MKPLVYLAGPITSDPLGHTRTAINVADELINSGFAPIVPHLSVLWQMISPKTHSEWLELDVEILRRCDALLRIAGESKGADIEVEFARTQRIPVFYRVCDLIDWKLSREHQANG